MSDPDGLKPDADPEEEGPASTPFDNPFFMPVMLLLFTLWLAYDGWINTGFIEAKQEAGELWKIGFNRWGAGVTGVLALLTGVRALKRRREKSQDPS